MIARLHHPWFLRARSLWIDKCPVGSPRHCDHSASRWELLRVAVRFGLGRRRNDCGGCAHDETPEPAIEELLARIERRAAISPIHGINRWF